MRKQPSRPRAKGMILKGFVPRGKGGAALITAIVFVFFLTLFGLAFYRLGETDIDLFGHDKNLSKALYASEAGIEKVRWMLREVAATNPFDKTFNEATAISIANPTGGDFFPGEEDKAYYKVSMIQDASILDPTVEGKVRVRVLGSLDVDADGEAGLTASEDVFTYDPDDVNRRFEAYIGLPGTLGLRFGIKGISAAAGAFYVGVAQVNLSSELRPFRTPDGDYVKDRNGDDRFLFFSGPGDFGVWDRWGFIFSDPAPTVASGEIDEIELPPGIFDTDGTYIDEDNNGIPDYFQDLNLWPYEGDKTFDADPLDPSKDPTSGANGRSVIYVNGNITIEGVDFGHLNDQGEVRNSDWEGYPSGEFDLTFIANGDITVDRVDCGNVGRLVLVAKNIFLVGDYNTKVNGIAIAYNDITLDGHPLDGGSWCEYGILTHKADFSRPVKYTAYFLGSMVAGNRINLQNDGWAVVYDENVINGKMYSTTLAKPTLTYERVETEDFNTTNNWETVGAEELKYTQENYIQEDIDNGQADHGDWGIDGTPELMKMYLEPIWHPADDDHDFPISDWVYCDFTNAANVFEDPDISVGPQDWDNYTTIHFWMALDNWQKTFLPKTTRRQSYFQLILHDVNGSKLSFNLSGWGNPIYSNNDWLTQPGNVRWMLVRITPQLVDPLSNFDMTNIVRMEFYYNDIRVFWYKNDIEWEWIGYDKTTTSGYGNDGYYYYMKSDGTGGHDKYPVWFSPPDANGSRQLNYTDPILGDTAIQWNWDPSTPFLTADMYFKDYVNPKRSALDSVLKIDRIELPGKPATNDYLNYGFPHCLRYEVTNWQEFKES
jgi:hypothetical protein